MGSILFPFLFIFKILVLWVFCEEEEAHQANKEESSLENKILCLFYHAACSPVLLIRREVPEKPGVSLGPHDTSSASDCAWHVADEQEVSVEGMNEQPHIKTLTALTISYSRYSCVVGVSVWGKSHSHVVCVSTDRRHKGRSTLKLTPKTTN